jgi:hypothetical protein
MNRLGVSAAFVEHFLTQHHDLVADALATTRAVDEHVVGPATDADAGAFLRLWQDVKDERGEPLVARANVYVSHAWDTPLHGTLGAMLAYAQTVSHAYFWLDLFCYNRYRGAVPDVAETVRQVLKDIGALLVVLSPWREPVWLGRRWGLLEFMCAMQVSRAHAVLIVVLGGVLFLWCLSV